MTATHRAKMGPLWPRNWATTTRESEPKDMWVTGDRFRGLGTTGAVAACLAFWTNRLRCWSGLVAEAACLAFATNRLHWWRNFLERRWWFELWHCCLESVYMSFVLGFSPFRQRQTPLLEWANVHNVGFTTAPVRVPSTALDRFKANQPVKCGTLVVMGKLRGV